MKKLFVVLAIFTLSLSYSESKAQAAWELGLRFWEKVSIEATVPVGMAPRLKPVVYIADDFGVAAFFDWMFALQDGPTGLKFFPGVGTEMFFDEFNLLVAGDFGAEYSFNFPLTIGIDWRPAIYLTNDKGFEANNWGLSARFRFGEGVKFKKE